MAFLEFGQRDEHRRACVRVLRSPGEVAVGHPRLSEAQTASARFSQGLHLELGPKGVYVQAVLPAATRTEIWERSGYDVSTLPALMETGELVDAALVGFDRRETVTIPSLPNADQWAQFDAARRIMLPNFNQAHAAGRYSKAA